MPTKPANFKKNLSISGINLKSFQNNLVMPNTARNIEMDSQLIDLSSQQSFTAEDFSRNFNKGNGQINFPIQTVPDSIKTKN